MTDEIRRVVSQLHQTRADMIGTADEAHYWHCHEAAALIERLAAEKKAAEESRDTYYLAAKVSAEGWSRETKWAEAAEAEVAKLREALREAEPAAWRYGEMGEWVYCDKPYPGGQPLYADPPSATSDAEDAELFRWLGDHACDVMCAVSRTDYGDGDTTLGPRVEVVPKQYPTKMYGSALEKLRAAVRAARKREG